MLALIAEGYSNRQIAERLGISENGVKGHVARLFARFDVPTRAALIAAWRASISDAEPDPISVLRASLEDVLGARATSALLRRACKEAGLDPDDVLGRARVSADHTGAVLAALWPVLIEASGQVLVHHLERLGFGAGGGVDLKEIASWIESNPPQT